jgi:DNA modification methylase
MIHIGDCLEVLRTLESGSVQTCVTSPPYWGLRDYGVEGQLGLEKTPDEYVAKMVDVFREVRRVLRDDGTLWLNLGDSYATGGGSIGRSPGGEDQGERYLRQGMIDTQPNRMKIDGLKPKDLVGIPWRVAFALQADGWYLRQDIIWHKPNPMPESVQDRCTKAHEYIFLMSKSERYYFDSVAMREPSSQPERSGKIEKSFSTGDRDAVLRMDVGRSVMRTDHRNRRSVWTVSTQPFKGAHFATFPPKLIEPCVLAGSKPGDTVLDPFNGAGTTGLVAHRNGREHVGIELPRIRGHRRGTHTSRTG